MLSSPPGTVAVALVPPPVKVLLVLTLTLHAPVALSPWFRLAVTVKVAVPPAGMVAATAVLVTTQSLPLGSTLPPALLVDQPLSGVLHAVMSA